MNPKLPTNLIQRTVAMAHLVQLSSHPNGDRYAIVWPASSHQSDQIVIVPHGTTLTLSEKPDCAIVVMS